MSDPAEYRIHKNHDLKRIYSPGSGSAALNEPTHEML